MYTYMYIDIRSEHRQEYSLKKGKIRKSTINRYHDALIRFHTINICQIIIYFREQKKIYALV